MISCRVLGPVELSLGDVPAPAELLWRKHLALLVYLAHSPQRTRSRDHLVGLLWGDKPEGAARHSLSEALRIIRRCGGEDAVVAPAGQVQLRDTALDLDTDRFETHCKAARWSDAAVLVAGEFMEGFAVSDAWEFEEWLATQRREWRRRSVEALVRAAQASMDAGALERAREWSERAIYLDRGSEAACRALMMSLALAGNRAAALERFDALTVHLHEEVGLSPDDETRRLADRIRRERDWRQPKREEPGAENRRPPLIGREGELARLVEVWERCRSTLHATLVLVDGDGGVGKSRLAEELVTRTRLEGARTAFARAVPADAAEAWTTARAVVRGGLGELASGDDAARAALAALSGDEPMVEDAREGEDGRVPSRGWALRSLLRTIVRDQPLVVVVDDAHHSDDASLAAIGGALRDLADLPLFVLLVSTPFASSPVLDDLRSRVGRDIDGAVVRLEPLRAAALRELCRWAMPAYDELQIERLARRVALDSAGLPLLAVELLHAVAVGMHLRDTPVWPEPARTVDQSIPSALAEPLVAAVRVNFRKLSPPAQQVLAAAAVLEERTSSALLARATGLDDDALTGALDELEWRRWLVGESRGFTFVARLVRDIVRRDMVSSAQRERIETRALRQPA